VETVWTPKRIVLLALGFVVFSTVYVIYASSSLGRINGLPPLPGAYYPDPDQANLDIPNTVPHSASSLEAKLIQAFGPGCRELDYPIRLELNAKQMLLASSNFQVLEDGRVCLTPLSVALFGKDKEKKPGGSVEINTLRGKVAYLTFDRPIKSLVPGQVGARRIVAAELTGDIVLSNNHSTAQRDDDLKLRIPTGPLYFDEAKRKIWTDDTIHLLDHQSKPHPHEVRGKGMDVELMTERRKPKPGQILLPQQHKEDISGVKSIVLRADVDLRLYVDGRSSFLGQAKKETGKPNVVKPLDAVAKDAGVNTLPANKDRLPAARPTLVNIRTPGRFRYEFFQDHDRAQFDVPERIGDAGHPQDVIVERHHEQENEMDSLVCQHLDLRIRRRKQQGEGHANQEEGQQLDIETAQATARKPKEVVLTSDTEKLIAFGTDFFYDAGKRLTVLKGGPEMEAHKEGSKIHARELRIQEAQLAPNRPDNPPVSYQRVTALGPGRISILDSKTQKHTIHAVWKHMLTATKEWDPRTAATATAPHDLLILTGSAEFQDNQHQQSLKARILKVWLEPRESDPIARHTPADDSRAQAAGRRPHHVEATGEVEARSPELRVHDTARLVVWFKDAPPQPTLPDEGTAPAGGARTKAVQETMVHKPVTPPPARPALTLGSASSPPPPKKKEAPRPIDLSARTVEAWVLREEDKNTLQRLWTEGHVRVYQEPAQPDEMGLAIKGQTMQMTCHPAGNYLVVSGGSGIHDDDDMAQLQMDKIYILGQEVNINQATNKAWVYGPGAMRIKSATNFQGEKLDEPRWLTIHWLKQMLFSGEYAEFQERIVADQDNARLACQRLQVFFDQPISLKRGGKRESQPQVQHLLCSDDVRVEDSVFAHGQRIRYQRIEGPLLEMRRLEAEEGQPRDRPGHTIQTAGPGAVRIWQQGVVESVASQSRGVSRKTTRPGQEEMKLTYVQFGARMDANSTRNTANFWENVRVLHLPSRDPEMHIDLDLILATDLPEGAMYLRCERLKVLDQPSNGQPNQEMKAWGGVYVQAKEFYARAAAVFYNQAKDQVIFVGDASGPATLYKRPIKGGEAQSLTGRKIIYYRTTGEATVEQGEQIQGRQ
jgi:hypothetical protein